MRIANVRGRAVLVTGNSSGIDISESSHGMFPSRVEALVEQWDRFVDWAASRDPATSTDERRFTLSDLDPVVANPPQVFAIGLNYAPHKDESGFASADEPVIFTKFASSLAGACSTVGLSSSAVDWEAELVVVIARRGRDIAATDAWGHIAGLTVGQDLSDRAHQFAGTPPQFSMAKSFRGYAPIGPWLVTPDELPDPDDLEIGCAVNGRIVQRDRTSNMILDVPGIVERISGVVELRPGDLIFTGTPAGVGMGADPPTFLRPGDELVTWASGIGQIRQTFRM